MLTLAFDTATDVATSALLEDDDVLGERTGRPQNLLEGVHELLAQNEATQWFPESIKHGRYGDWLENNVD